MPNTMNRLSTFIRDKVNRGGLGAGGGRTASTLDFKDMADPSGGNSRILQSTASSNNRGFVRMPDDGNGNPTTSAPVPLVNQIFPKPLNLRRNKTEINRLQGLMKKNSASTYSNHEDDAAFNASFAVAPPANQTRLEKLRHWFINEGARRTVFALWCLVHAMVFAFGFVHYQMKGAS